MVTGSSRGIGAETVRLAATRGYAVAVNYRENRDSAEALVREIQKQGRAVAVQADVSSEADVVRLFETVDRSLGPVTALVNNAGVVDRGIRVSDMTAARIARMFSINVTGSFLCAREAVRRMSTRLGGKGGVIVNVSSIASRLGGAGEYVDTPPPRRDDTSQGLAKEVDPKASASTRYAPDHPHRDPSVERRSGASRAHRPHRAAAAAGRSLEGRAPLSGCSPTRLRHDRRVVDVTGDLTLARRTPARTHRERQERARPAGRGQIPD